MISKQTATAYRLTNAAVEVLEGAGCTDADVVADVAGVIAEGFSGAHLLAVVLDGADEASAIAWREYVACIVAAARADD